jgi:hypothetical protein
MTVQADREFQPAGLNKNKRAEPRLVGGKEFHRINPQAISFLLKAGVVKCR